MIIGGIEKAVWSKTDRARLRQLWLDTTESEIISAFPGRTWKALIHQAHKMKIRRRRQPTMHLKRGNRLAADLTKARLAARLSQGEIAKIIGLPSQSAFGRFEIDATHLSLFMLRAWCDALGLELRAMPSGKKAKKPRTKPTAAEKMKQQATADMARWRQAAE